MSDLSKLFNKYGSDKAINKYDAVYEALFKNIIFRVQNVLEIGVGTMVEGAHSSMVGFAQSHYSPGGSLRAWRDYFPLATIFGVDPQEDAQIAEERIVTVRSSSFSDNIVSLLESVDLDGADIIIDDGSHIPEDQMATMSIILPRFGKPGGYYVVEDCYAGSPIKRYAEDFTGKGVFLNDAQNLVVVSL